MSSIFLYQYNKEETQELEELTRLPTMLILSSALIVFLSTRFAHADRVEDPQDISPRASTSARQLQEDEPTVFRAEYLAQFMALRDENCNGPEPPVVRIHCMGDIGVTETSETIVCESTPTEHVEGFNGLECTSTCTPDVDNDVSNPTPYCSEVVVGSGETAEDGPFSEIYFYCEAPEDFQVTADDAEYLEGAITWPDTVNGTCAEGSNSRNFRVSRLGVSCPTVDGGDEREFTFDQFFFECSSLSDNFGDDPTKNELICYSGRNCEGEACEIDFDWFTLFSVPSKFDDGCLGVPLRSTSALFQMGWAALINEEDPTCTEVDVPSIRISCTNGIVEFVEATRSTTTCTEDELDPSVLSCQDSSSTNIFSRVTYKCIAAGTIIPETIVEFPETDVSCANRENALQLGVECNDSSGLYVYSTDAYFDCSRGTQIGYVNEDNESFGDGSLYTCSVRASEGETIQPIQISTDPSWVTSRPPGCHENITTLARENLAPTASPLIGLPNAPHSSGGGSSSVGGIVGGTVGGLVLVLIMAALWRRKPKSGNDDDDIAPKNSSAHHESNEPDDTAEGDRSASVSRNASSSRESIPSALPSEPLFRESSESRMVSSQQRLPMPNHNNQVRATPSSPVRHGREQRMVPVARALSPESLVASTSASIPQAKPFRVQLEP